MAAPMAPGARSTSITYRAKTAATITASIARRSAPNFSGIEGIPNQDAAVQESMGPIVDRSREVLGHSDRAVVLFRRMMLRLAEECAAGREPKAAKHGAWYNVRPASLLLDRNVPFEEGAARIMAGTTRAAAE